MKKMESMTILKLHELEIEFNNVLMSDRNGEFKEINDQFYENMAKQIKISGF